MPLSISSRRRAELAAIAASGDARAMEDWAHGLERDLPAVCVAAALAAAETVVPLVEREVPRSHVHAKLDAVRAWLAAPTDANASTAMGRYVGDRPTGYEGLAPPVVVDGVELGPAAELAYWTCDAAARAAGTGTAEPAREAIASAIEAHVAAGAQREDAVRTVAGAMVRGLDARCVVVTPPPFPSGPRAALSVPLAVPLPLEIDPARVEALLPEIAAVLGRAIATPPSVHEHRHPPPAPGWMSDRTTTLTWRGDGVVVRLVTDVTYLDGVDREHRLEIALDGATLAADTRERGVLEASDPALHDLALRLRPLLERL